MLSNIIYESSPLIGSLTASEKPVRPSQAIPSSAMRDPSYAPLPSTIASPAPDMFASISYTDSDVSPELRQAEIELHRHIHSLLSDAWKQNALLSKQLLGARNDLDAAYIQIERLTCDLEAERVSRTDAEAMCQDLQDKLADVTSERDMFTYQSEALIAARAALAQDLLAIDLSSEEEPEECTDSD